MAAVASKSGSHHTSLARHCRVLFAAIGLWSGGHPQVCEAVLMHAGASDADHINLGLAHSTHVLWVKGEALGAFYYFSAIRINDHFAVTAAHAVMHPDYGVFVPALIGDGPNRLVDPGNVRQIAAVKVYPTYSGASGYPQPDIAILKFTQPLSGASPTFAPPQSIVVGQVVTAAGYGVPGFTDTGFRPEDGQLRGWDARIESETSHFNSQFYENTYFYPNSMISLNGRGSNGDSGSPVYDGQGRLAGMNIGNTPGTLHFDPIGTTIFLDLTNPTVRAWIEANTAIPDPPNLAINVTSTTAQFNFSNMIPAREYRVMRSSTLGAWEEAHRFTAITTTGSWSEALVPGGRRFYRLEWNE
jgi:hypothetical protein